MAICLTCGAIRNDEDHALQVVHECNPDDVPGPGKEHRPQVIGKASVIKSPDGAEWDVSVSDAGAISATKRS